jgi:GH18 family chitinase
LLSKAYRVVCYYTNWSQYRTGNAKFLPANIDPSLCTHIMFAFAKLTNGLLDMVEWNDQSMYAAVEALRSQNPNLKVLLSVGGWNMGSGPFSDMAISTTARAAFVSSTVTFLQQYGFDGLDLDWVF